MLPSGISQNGRCDNFEPGCKNDKTVENGKAQKMDK
jgi:hypothetical protein